MKTTTFICKLSIATQEQIKNDITTFLKSEGYTNKEIIENVEIAMNGRLSDLEETIDIKKYL